MIKEKYFLDEFLNSEFGEFYHIEKTGKLVLIKIRNIIYLIYTKNR